MTSPTCNRLEIMTMKIFGAKLVILWAKEGIKRSRENLGEKLAILPAKAGTRSSWDGAWLNLVGVASPGTRNMRPPDNSYSPSETGIFPEKSGCKIRYFGDFTRRVRVIRRSHVPFPGGS